MRTVTVFIYGIDDSVAGADVAEQVELALAATGRLDFLRVDYLPPRENVG